MFGDKIEEAPYLLEKIIEDEQDLSAIQLQSFIVVACMRLFFKRAPEMKPILASYFQQTMKNSSDADLKQRIMFYYRLLKQDIQLAEKVINQKEAMESTQFFEDKQSEKRERLFMEFNSLSVVYGRPSEKFLKDSALK